MRKQVGATTIVIIGFAICTALMLFGFTGVNIARKAIVDGLARTTTVEATIEGGEYFPNDDKLTFAISYVYGDQKVETTLACNDCEIDWSKGDTTPTMTVWIDPANPFNYSSQQLKGWDIVLLVCFFSGLMFLCSYAGGHIAGASLQTSRNIRTALAERKAQQNRFKESIREEFSLRFGLNIDDCWNNDRGHMDIEKIVGSALTKPRDKTLLQLMESQFGSGAVEWFEEMQEQAFDIKYDPRG